VKQYSYFFEQSSLLNLFVSAFDEAFVYRYDARTREPKEKIEVRYVHGPKHRVLHDLNDRAKTLTLPVVTIEQTSISRDPTRVFNKNKHFYHQGSEQNSLTKIPTPIPVNIELAVSVICYFKEDLDQILQNFITNCNPYIIVSWKTPEDFDLPFLEEIRSEIQWSGDAPITNPKDLSPDVKWRISADTSFTIKGWMFKSIDETVAPIYKIDANFKNVNLSNRVYAWEDFPSLSGNFSESDVVSISAYPSFTNIFYNYQNIKLPIHDNLIIDAGLDNNFLLYGKRFDYNNTWYLSSGEVDFYTNFELVSTARSPLISAYNITDWVTVENDNVARINIPANSLSTFGEFKIITANEASWNSYPDFSIYAWVSGNSYYSYYDGISGYYIQPDGDGLYIHPITITELYDRIN
jgi:hypothetical protein